MTYSFVALYDIRPGNGAGLSLQPWSPQGSSSSCVILLTNKQTNADENKTRLVDVYVPLTATNRICIIIIKSRLCQSCPNARTETSDHRIYILHHGHPRMLTGTLKTSCRREAATICPAPVRAARCGPAPAHTRLAPGLRRPVRFASSSCRCYEYSRCTRQTSDVRQRDVRKKLRLMPPP